MVSRVLVFGYGLLAYAVFLATILYAIGFVGNVPLLPRTIDGAPVGDIATSVLVDLGLLALFALQHSVMARAPFKRLLTRVIPEAAERSTYVLCSSAALIVLFAFWRPLGGEIWRVEGAAATALMALCAAGWVLVFAATFLIHHFDLFGLRQVWCHLRDVPRPALTFRTPGPYRLVRHPLYVGFIVAFWATPVMTATHLLFALATTLYIVVAIRFEERDLVHDLGDAYRDYARRVPMLVPGLRRSPSRVPVDAAVK